MYQRKIRTSVGSSKYLCLYMQSDTQMVTLTWWWCSIGLDPQVWDWISVLFHKILRCFLGNCPLCWSNPHPFDTFVGSSPTEIPTHCRVSTFSSGGTNRQRLDAHGCSSNQKSPCEKYLNYIYIALLLASFSNLEINRNKKSIYSCGCSRLSSHISSGCHLNINVLSSNLMFH